MRGTSCIIEVRPPHHSSSTHFTLDIGGEVPRLVAMEDKIDPDESTYHHTADELLALRPFSPTVTQIPRARQADAAAPSQPLPHPALSHWRRSHLGTLGQDDRRCARLAHREPLRGSDTLRDYRRAFVTSSFRQLGRVASSDCKRALAASSPAHPPAHVDALLSGATRASALYRAVPTGCGAPIRVRAHRLLRHLARVAPRAYTPRHHYARPTAPGHHRRGPCRSTAESSLHHARTSPTSSLHSTTSTSPFPAAPAAARYVAGYHRTCYLPPSPVARCPCAAARSLPTRPAFCVAPARHVARHCR